MSSIIENILELTLAAILAGGIVWFAFIKKFVTSYMTEKGKNLATREDFEQLLEQLRKTTRETESIRTELSASHWLRQQYWSKREQYYMDLLAELTKLHVSLTDRNNYYMEPNSVYNASIPNEPQYQKLGEHGRVAYQKIQELVGPAAVFLSEKSVSILRKLIGDYWEAAEFSSHHAEFLASAVVNVDYAYTEVLAEAKAELIPNAGTNPNIAAKSPLHAAT